MKNIFLFTLLIATLLAWSGCKNKEENEAAKLLLTKVRLKKFPASKAEDVPWDISSNSAEQLPDLRLQVVIDSALVWTDSYLYSNAKNYLYYEYPFESYLIGNMDDSYTLILYDIDGSLATSDIICRLTFRPADIIEGYPQSFEVENDECAFEIYCNYIF